jgi:hypothetical protein
MRSAITRCECKGLHTGQASLFDRCVHEGIKEHVESVANKGMLVELLHHITPHLKDELQVLQSEEIGWTLATFCVWVGQ